MSSDTAQLKASINSMKASISSGTATTGIVTTTGNTSGGVHSSPVYAPLNNMSAVTWPSSPADKWTVHLESPDPPKKECSFDHLNREQALSLVHALLSIPKARSAIAPLVGVFNMPSGTSIQDTIRLVERGDPVTLTPHAISTLNSLQSVANLLAVVSKELSDTIKEGRASLIEEITK